MAGQFGHADDMARPYPSIGVAGTSQTMTRLVRLSETNAERRPVVAITARAAAPPLPEPCP
jgi:hypothetical protein